MKSLFLVAAVLSSCVALTTAPTALAADTPCVGTLVGTFENVVVPPRAFCTLHDSIVHGNVEALKDSRLIMSNDLVGGRVEGDNASAVQVIDSTVGGDIKIVGAHDGYFTAAVVMRSVLTNGNIEIEKGRFPFGNWLVQTNEVAKGSITVEENGTLFTSVLTVNTFVAEDVRVLGNFGPALKIVAINRIGGNLRCEDNTEPFLSFGNVVGGTAEGQCAAEPVVSALSLLTGAPESSLVDYAGGFPVLKRVG